MNLHDAICLFVNNMKTHGLNDITKESWEKQLIIEFSDDFIKDTKKSLERNSILEMEFKQNQYLLTPKNRYIFDYRKAALIAPSCLAKFGALTLMAAEAIEKGRIPISEKIVYSYRFSPSGADIFDKNVNYDAWKLRIKELANDSSCTYVVHCDIASFYDRINLHRVESTLQDVGVDKNLVRKINDLLLFWSRKDSYGVPVGNVPSRIIAEAALIDVDKYLVSEGIKYVRYVDDYRIFSPDIVTAQKWMNKLTTRLFREGLMLNTGKTRIVLAHKEEGEAVIHSDEAEVVVKMITKLTGGYNKIPKKFYMPSSDKYDAFLKINIDNEMAQMHSNGILEFDSIQKVVIACLVQHNFDGLIKMSEICRSYLYSLEYFADMLIKNGDTIPEKHRNILADDFHRLVIGSQYNSLEWHEATIALLLSDKNYLRKDTLFHIVKSRTTEESSYPTMIALEGLFGKITRTEFKTIREWYTNCDDWGKRRMNQLSRILPEEEWRAWAKIAKQQVSHDFLSHQYLKKHL